MDMRELRKYQYAYFGRVIRNHHTGTIMLQQIDMNEMVELGDRDEFVTFLTKVDLERVPWGQTGNAGDDT